MISDEKIRQFTLDDSQAVRDLALEVQRLRAAIREHKSATGHALCWLNDLELWHKVDADAKYPHDSLPVREEFLGQCARYYQSRVAGTSYAEPDVKHKVTD